jgi:hypothetical protein
MYITMADSNNDNDNNNNNRSKRRAANLILETLLDALCWSLWRPRATESPLGECS